MRTNIDIDQELLRQAGEIAGTRTKRATVEYALQELIRRKRRQSVLAMRGAIEWQGDLDEMRSGRQV